MPFLLRGQAGIPTGDKLLRERLPPPIPAARVAGTADGDWTPPRLSDKQAPKSFFME